jgi:hypothetical protein
MPGSRPLSVAISIRICDRPQLLDPLRRADTLYTAIGSTPR